MKVIKIIEFANIIHKTNNTINISKDKQYKKCIKQKQKDKAIDNLMSIGNLIEERIKCMVEDKENGYTFFTKTPEEADLLRNYLKAKKLGLKFDNNIEFEVNDEYGFFEDKLPNKFNIKELYENEKIADC